MANRPPVPLPNQQARASAATAVTTPLPTQQQVRSQAEYNTWFARSQFYAPAARYTGLAAQTQAKEAAKPDGFLGSVGSVLDAIWTDDFSKVGVIGPIAAVAASSWQYTMENRNQVATYGLSMLPGGTQTVSWDDAARIHPMRMLVAMGVEESAQGGSAYYAWRTEQQRKIDEWQKRFNAGDPSALLSNPGTMANPTDGPAPIYVPKGWDITNPEDEKWLFGDPENPDAIKSPQASQANIVSGAMSIPFEWFLDPLVVVGKGVKVGRLGTSAFGLDVVGQSVRSTNSVKAMRQIESELDDFMLYTQTNGAQGAVRGAGLDAVNIAQRPASQLANERYARGDQWDQISPILDMVDNERDAAIVFGALTGSRKYVAMLHDEHAAIADALGAMRRPNAYEMAAANAPVGMPRPTVLTDLLEGNLTADGLLTDLMRKDNALARAVDLVTVADSPISQVGGRFNTGRMGQAWRAGKTERPLVPTLLQRRNPRGAQFGPEERPPGTPYNEGAAMTDAMKVANARFESSIGEAAWDGGPRLYHGSKTPIEGDLFGNAAGFNTTGLSTVARGYAGKNGEVYNVRWTGKNPPAILDGTSRASDRLRSAAQKVIADLVPSNSYSDNTADGAALFPTLLAATRGRARSSTISVLRAAQKDLKAAGASNQEIQRVMSKLRAAIKKDGYDAVEHSVGGKPTTTFLNPKKLKAIRNETAGKSLRTPDEILNDEMIPLVRGFLPDRMRTPIHVEYSPAVYETVYQLSKNFRKVAVWEWVQGSRGSGWLTVRGQDDGYASQEWEASLLESKALKKDRDFVQSLISEWQYGVSDTANLERAAAMEEAATKQIARHYFGAGATAEDGQLMEDLAVGMYRALQKKRMDAMSALNRGKGRVYGVDPADGALITAGPMLRSQLETKIPLMDFRLMDKMMSELADPAMKPFLREIADVLITQAGGDSVAIARRLGAASEHTKWALEGINSAWKAAVLMRLGYTQRNVVEGWLRTWAVLGMIPALAPSNIVTGIGRAFPLFGRNARNKAGLGRIEGAQKELSKVMQQEREISVTLENDVARLLQRSIPAPDPNDLRVSASVDSLTVETVYDDGTKAYRFGVLEDRETGAVQIVNDVNTTTIGERAIARAWRDRHAARLEIHHKDFGRDPVATVLNARAVAAGTPVTDNPELATFLRELADELPGANDHYVYDLATVNLREAHVRRTAERLDTGQRELQKKVKTWLDNMNREINSGRNEEAAYWLSKAEDALNLDSEVTRIRKATTLHQRDDIVILDHADLPDFVYHVTPASTQIAREGILRMSDGQGGGLGGVVSAGMVSVTGDRKVALQLRDDMRFYAALRQRAAAGDLTLQEVIDAMRLNWARSGGNLTEPEWTNTVNYADILIPSRDDLVTEEKWETLQNIFFDNRRWATSSVDPRTRRPVPTGPDNPIIINHPGRTEFMAAEDIEIIAIPRENIPRDVVLEDNGFRGSWGEHGEIRVHGDIPIGNRQLTDVKNRVIYDQLYTDTVRQLDEVDARLNDYAGVMAGWSDQKAKLGKKYIGWDEAFGDPIRGEIYRSNASNDQTVKNFFESKAARDAAIARLDDEKWIDVTPDAPQYFDELSGAAIQLRNDPLASIAMGMRGPDTSVDAMLRWLDTDQGKAYARGMALFDDQRKLSRATQLSRIVNGYFPTPEARALASRKGNAPTGAELRGVLGGRDDLADIHGREIKVNTTSEDPYHAIIGTIFKYLGSLPDSALVRQPFYNEVWKRETSALYRKAFAQGEDINDAAVIARIEETAHRRSLKATNDTLYTIVRYSNPAAALRFLSPFFSAWENSIRTWSRIIVNDPSVAARASILWDLPNRLGMVVDENGDPVASKPGDFLNGSVNQFMVLPKPLADAIQSGLTDLSDNAMFKGNVLGDIIKGAGEFPLKVPKGSLNVVAPGETPFLPGMGPVVTYPVGNILASKPDMQQFLKDTLGDAVYAQIAPFGQASGDILDTVFPAAGRKGVQLFVGENNDDYMRVLDAITVDAIVTWRQAGGEPGDRPDPLELKERADSFYKFSMLASLTLPVSITRMSDYQPILNAWRKMSSDPTMSYRDAVTAFLDKYGDSYLPLTRSTSKSAISGLDPTLEMYQTMTEYRDEVAMLTARTSEDGGWGASLIAATIPNGEFNPGVYEYWRSQRQPGSTSNYKTAMTPEEIMVEDNISRMWKDYITEKNMRDTALASLGGIAWDSKKSEEIGIKGEWEKFIDGMYDKYGNDFVQYGPNAYGPKLPQTLAMVDTLLKDDKFMQSDLGESATWQAIKAYMDERGRARAAIMAGADKDAVKALWSEFTATHRYSSLQFSDFYDTFLEDDDLTERMAGDGSPS